MITVALGQIVWGIAYRWISLTNGDNGVSINARPTPFGLSLVDAPEFYWACLVVFLVTVAAMAIFVASPFGAALRGTRDQPRRMTALGYNVWLTRFLAFLFSGFWSGVAGLLYLYYNQFISPQAVALSASAEALLMVIAGGTATLLGPIAGAVLVIIMKDVASAYIERWNFVLGAIFVLIVVFMPEGLVPGSRAAVALGAGSTASGSIHRGNQAGSRAMTALEVRDLQQVVRRLARHHRGQPRRRARRAPADHRPERRRQDHAVQPDHRRTVASIPAASRCSAATSPRAAARRRAHLGTGAHLPDHHAVSRRDACCAT